jgi:Tfp pilus assembly protein PilV
MRNQKGLTLVEVLGSIVLLSVAILSLTYVIQQASVHTRDNEKTDQSVQITRTVMEEIKKNLKNQTSTSVRVYGKDIPLSAMRSASGMTSFTINYPNDANPQYRILIQSAASGLGSVNISEVPTADLDQLFRKITITSTNISSSKQYQLEAIVEYS